ncbi:hyperosmotically inducible protein [Paraburkholderia youngii]|uniref:BON domain-containing protein n=1 Tax=Paraburkholderia youngii TaxID=2782701 RepID=A0ABX2NLK9_9BURK|nr:BON domain-containing protein [Paraburkholderia youngii]NUX56571.1 BON domain-containing protein [Paraburkholderia youngii]NVI05304.1 BON domain-containing protein [Paraburkholderia youngii]
MKTSRALKIAVGLLVGSTYIHVWAQASESEALSVSKGTVTEAAGGMSATSNLKANFLLRRKVYAAIARHKEINAGNISVVVKRGAVTLDGTVADASQIGEATEIAKGVPGVTSVTNRLTVKKPFGSQ